MPLRTYRKRPVEVQAAQLNWANWLTICDLLRPLLTELNAHFAPAEEVSDTCGETDKNAYIKLMIPTLEGNHTALHGDYIVRGIQGEFYPVKPDIFLASYDKVSP